MKWLSDPTRRFLERPHFSEAEVQQRVDAAIATCFHDDRPSFPIGDNDLDLLVDSVTSHYDPQADLRGHLGADVEGVTIFRPGEKARVKISNQLMDNTYRLRRRMTIAHEVGHVLLHCELYGENRTLDLFSDSAERGRVYCKQATMLPGVDWMEWQASYAGGVLLMPSGAIRDAMAELRGNKIEHPVYPDEPEAQTIVRRIASIFEVSIDAAKVRLMQTGFIEQHRSIQRLPLWGQT